MTKTKSHSRKGSANNSSSVALKKTQNFSSAAAVSVTKFGQATFTSVRRQDCENGNGSYVLLKKATKTEPDDAGLKKEEPPAAAPKPKVYKFFKSRSSAQQNESNNAENKPSTSSTPKALVLNNYSKQDGVKRYCLAFCCRMLVTDSISRYACLELPLQH